jgi:hypothetical protein
MTKHQPPVLNKASIMGGGLVIALVIGGVTLGGVTLGGLRFVVCSSVNSIPSGLDNLHFCEVQYGEVDKLLVIADPDLHFYKISDLS